MCSHFQFLLLRTKKLAIKINPKVPLARVIKTAIGSKIENVKVDFLPSNTKVIKPVVIVRPAPAIKSRSKNVTLTTSLLLLSASRKRNRTLKLIDRCHTAINDASSRTDTRNAVKASEAVRYLALTRSQSHGYHSVNNDHERLSARNKESNRTFQWVMDKLNKLAGFKVRNDQLTDSEYRRTAEDIVRERTV